jgi:hypothetical protein
MKTNKLFTVARALACFTLIILISMASFVYSEDTPKDPLALSPLTKIIGDTAHIKIFTLPFSALSITILCLVVH